MSAAGRRVSDPGLSTPCTPGPMVECERPRAASALGPSQRHNVPTGPLYPVFDPAEEARAVESARLRMEQLARQREAALAEQRVVRARALASRGRLPRGKGAYGFSFL